MSHVTSLHDKKTNEVSILNKLGIWTANVDKGVKKRSKQNVMHFTTSFSPRRRGNVEKPPFLSDRIPLFDFTT